MGKSKRAKDLERQIAKNSMLKELYRIRLKLLCETMFKWEGLPDEIPERYIERNLFRNGKLAFFKDKYTGEFMCTFCNGAGKLNHYQEYDKYTCYTDDGFNRIINREDIVIIRNNTEEVNTYIFIEPFVEELYQIQATKNVNIMQQKTPTLLLCDESDRLTLENFFLQYQGNIPAVWGTKQLSNILESVKTVNLKCEYLADKLQQAKKDTWSDCFDMLGINNANTNKRERLITDEVNSNNQLLQLSAETFLSCRKEACEEIKKKFGLDVSVKLRVQNIDTKLDVAGEDNKEEGEENGNLYNGTEGDI